MAHSSDERFPSGSGDVSPETSDELSLLRSIRRARTAARYAGRNSSHVEPLRDEELEAPLDLDVPPASEGEDVATRSAPLPQIDGYRLLGEVGSGGQATVYKAIQEVTGRVVAIKVIADGVYATSRGRARFEREARILAALDHPHIVGILDRGRTSEGAFFIAMPFVDGQGLAEYVEAVLAENVDRILPLMRAVLDAVAEAHRRGIVHRDLKPSNIRVDGRGEPRVLDFGLARLLETGEADAPTTTAVPVEITRTGQIMGSLPWLSPEQAAGAASMLDFRSDVYALGLLLYFALAGHLPYPTNVAVGQVLDNIRNTIPRPPSEVAPKRGISPGLDAIVLKALSKAAPDRFPSAVELAAELTACIEGRATTSGVSSRARLRRRSWVLIAGVTAASFLLCAAGVVAVKRVARFNRTAAATETNDLSVPQPSQSAALDAAGLYSANASNVRPQNTASTAPTTPLSGLPDGIGLRFVRIPAGEFLMGSPTDEPQRSDLEKLHRVRISRDYWMSVTEVTQRQYERVTGMKRWDPQFNDPDLPADEITWDDAAAFCKRMAEIERCVYRLPSEAEWEYACRAGSTQAFGGSGNLLEMGWYEKNSGGRLHPVGAKSPNAWGLSDMHGNVAEWCADYFRDYPVTRELLVDPKGPSLAVHRVLRGGSAHDTWDLCRSAKRVPRDPKVGLAGMGFRVVREVQPQSAPTEPANTNSRGG